MLAALKTDRAHALRKLEEMELNQIAEWVKVLPEDKWENLFLSRWPALAKKCGIQEEELLHMH